MVRAEKRASRILATVLDGAAVLTGSRNSKSDLFVSPRGDRHRIGLDVIWAGEGWPEDVRRAAAAVPTPWPARLVLLARHLSPGAIEWLRERGANWADETGQARILGPSGLIVIREPAVVPREIKPQSAVAWSRSAIAIAEAILAAADGPLQTQALAQATGWSVPQVGTVLKSFDSQEWTAKRGAARGRNAYREVVNADGLLTSWTAHLTQIPKTSRMTHRATRDLMSLLRSDLAPSLDRNVRWAASGWAGLELVAPFMTTVPSIHIYVDEVDFGGSLSNAIDDAGLREVDEGGRVIFWRADSLLLQLASPADGIAVASAPRIYADLSFFGGRGQDAADHLKQQLIDPLHPKQDHVPLD